MCKSSANSLKTLFSKKSGRVTSKWTNYFDVYEKHLQKYKGENIKIIEIGVRHGGSLDVWKKYFGEDSKIYGIDINPRCKKLQEKNKKIFIGDQSNEEFLKEVVRITGKPDIVIDDGGHKMDQQKKSFEFLYGKTKKGGVYICEDTHTSYHPGWGGGLRKSSTFIEMSKRLVDRLHEWHYKEDTKVSNFCKSTFNISFYDNIVVIEKKDRKKPKSVRRGNISIDEVEKNTKKDNKKDDKTFGYIKSAKKTISELYQKTKSMRNKIEIKIRNKIYT
jgi:cephalosporin hydroxylase